MAIQALQPRVKEIQEKYKGRDPQEAQVSQRTLFLLFPAMNIHSGDCIVLCTYEQASTKVPSAGTRDVCSGQI